MFFLSTLAFSFFISPALSMWILDSDADFPGPTTLEDNIVPVATTLRVVNDYVEPDGYRRSAAVVNGQVPGPLIRGNKGDTFSIKVENRLTDPNMPLETSIHWHGIFQHKSNWADGVAYVTQCPLRPGESFTYKFNPGEQTGTYWYHSHYQAQYCDGLRGPLVIYDPRDPFKSKQCTDEERANNTKNMCCNQREGAGPGCYTEDDENTIITLAEWYHQPSIILDREFPAPPRDSVLINGKGRYDKGPVIPLSVINVQPGSRYRLRLVSMACNTGFNFAIDGHTMTVIEVDGNEVRPVEVDSLTIAPAQRYSVVITANQAVANYWIRARRDGDVGVNSAILRYAGAPEGDPVSPVGPYARPLNQGDLHPLVNPAAPVNEVGGVDERLVLRVGNTSDHRFTINGVSFEPPSMAVLLQILSGRRRAEELMPQGSVYLLPKDKIIEISFPSPVMATDAPHPIHLHGHDFSVVRLPGTQVMNVANPVRRDTFSIGNRLNDNTAIRFKTDNPGPWILHCHIDWHFTHGFAVVLAEAPDEADEEERQEIPQEWWDMCREGEDWGQTNLELPDA